ncbi:amino acid permease family protein, partial [Striga asiatica]
NFLLTISPFTSSTKEAKFLSELPSFDTPFFITSLTFPISLLNSFDLSPSLLIKIPILSLTSSPVITSPSHKLIPTLQSSTTNFRFVIWSLGSTRPDFDRTMARLTLYPSHYPQIHPAKSHHNTQNYPLSRAARPI